MAGLNVLLGMDLLQGENVELDVFSSCDLYGSKFAKDSDDIGKLYEQAKALPNVNYRQSSQ